MGERWLADRWTVAEEHLASGVSQKALDAVAHTIEPPAVTGLVVVTCTEGDWHSLPAQMFAELLRAQGGDERDDDRERSVTAPRMPCTLLTVVLIRI